MTIQELRQKDMYTIKNILFKSIIIDDVELENNCKIVIREFLNK